MYTNTCKRVNKKKGVEFFFFFSLRLDSYPPDPFLNPVSDFKAASMSSWDKNEDEETASVAVSR